MRSTPTRIVMLSAFTLEGAEATLGALDAGALDFIAKRTLGGGPASDGARQLIAQLRAVAASPIARSARQSVVASVLAKPAPQPTPASVQAGGLGALGLLVLGASTGGPALLGELMAAVPAGFPAPILLVVHMPQGFTGFFAERLSRRCRLPVIEAVDGAPLIPGQVLLAPGGMQTRLRRVRSQLVTEILPGTADALYRPSIDFVLESVAAELGPQALAVILTGMGNDGTRGAASVVKSGGRVWAQDQASSAVFGMPSSVVRAGHVSRVVSVTELAQLLDGSR